MIEFQKFTVKDIIFLAITGAAFVVGGMLTIPFVMSLGLYGLPHMVTAPVFAFIAVIALLKVRKPGTLFIAATFNGLVLFMMSPMMLWMQMGASLAAELIALLLFRTYACERGVLTAAILFIPLAMPLGVVFNMLIRGGTLETILTGEWWAIGVVYAVTIVLSILGGLLGRKIGRELQKAGKLK
jgi:energy-coupling factor transport system substrate-specific component